MSSATLTDTASRSFAVAWRIVAVAAFAVGLGWLAGSADVPITVLTALGVVALCGVLVTPSRLAQATMVLVPFTGIIASQFVGLISGNTNLTDAALAAFAISAFSHRPASSRPQTWPVVPVMLGAVLMLVLAVGLVASPESGEGIRKVLRIALAAMVLLAPYRALTPIDAQRCMRLLVIATTAACGLGFVVTIIRAPQVTDTLRLWGGLVDPNHFGILVGAVLTMTLIGVRFKTRAAWVSVVVILLIAELATLSRSGAITLIVGVIAVAVGGRLTQAPGLRLQVSSRLLVLFLLGGITMAGVAALAPQFAGSTVDRLAKALNPAEDRSGALRITAFETGIGLLEQDPLTGTGPASFQEAIAGTGSIDGGIEAHNSLLESAVEFGIVAGLCIAALIVWGVVRSARIVRSISATGDETRIRTALAGWAGLVASITGSFMLANFLYQGAFLAVCIIVIAACNRAPEDSLTRRPV